MVQGDTRRRRAFVGLSMLVMVGLAGCSQGDPPEERTPVVVQPSPTVSTPSPSPSPSSTVLAEPEKPAEWTGDSEAAAIAAAQYFMDLYMYARSTGDLTEWDALSGQTCGFCAGIHEDVTSVYASGDRLAGGSMSTSDYRVIGVDTQLASYGVQFRYTQSTSERTGADGTVIDSYKGDQAWLALNLAPTGNGWVLLGAERTDEGL